MKAIHDSKKKYYSHDYDCPKCKAEMEHRIDINSKDYMYCPKCKQKWRYAPE